MTQIKSRHLEDNKPTIFLNKDHTTGIHLDPNNKWDSHFIVHDEAGANYLMGKLYMEQFQKFDLAEEYFESSMASEPENINTCESYAWLLIRTRRFKEALKLIRFALDLKGVMVPDFMRLEALVYELRKDFGRSEEMLNKAIEESYDSSYISFLENELSRVRKKIKKTLDVKYHVAK